MRRAQAAMEFLMTYGWAILVVLAAIGALAYFGVLSPDRFLPEKCTLPSGVACLDFSATGASITLSIQNSGGFDMQNVVVNLTNGVNAIPCTVVLPGTNTVPDGTKNSYTCLASAAVPAFTNPANQFPPGKFKATIGMYYKNAQTLMDHSKQGELIAKIT